MIDTDGGFRLDPSRLSGELEDYRATVATLRNPSLSLEDLAKKIDGMSPQDRLILSFLIGGEKGITNPDDYRIGLLLSGVPAHVVKDAYNPSVSHYDFIQNLHIADLPVDMQASTRGWVTRAREFGENNRQRLQVLAAEYSVANTSEARKKVIAATFAQLRPDFALKDTELSFESKGKRDAPFRTDNKTGQVRVNLNSAFFDDNQGRAGFRAASAALLHELLHTHQRQWINNSQKQEYISTPSNTYINYVGHIDFDPQSANNKPYVAQPMEMQAHIAQRIAEEMMRQYIP